MMVRQPRFVPSPRWFVSQDGSSARMVRQPRFARMVHQEARNLRRYGRPRATLATSQEARSCYHVKGAALVRDKQCPLVVVIFGRLNLCFSCKTSCTAKRLASSSNLITNKKSRPGFGGRWAELFQMEEAGPSHLTSGILGSNHRHPNNDAESRPLKPDYN